jgi:hypothetical protein
MRNSNIELVLPPYHSEIQKLIMNFHLMPVEVRELWIACGTKFGKTASASVLAINTLTTDEGDISRWFAPVYNQSKIGMRYCSKMLPRKGPAKEYFDVRTTGVPEIRSYSNDAIFQFMHAGNPESAEGEGTRMNILDEAAKYKDSVLYETVAATTTFTQGKTVAISTPNGRNWFYHKCMEAKEEMIRAKHENRLPEKIFLTAPTTANPFVPRSSVASLKRRLSDRLYRQFVKADFLEDGGVFYGLSKASYGGQLPEWHPEERQRWILDPDHDLFPKEGTPIYVGVDWGKRRDFVVITAVCKVGEKIYLIGFDRFNRRSYKHAVQEVLRFCEQIGSVEMLVHDRTGVGDVVEEYLEDTELPYHGIVWNNTNKDDMVQELMVSFEISRIKIPKWITLIDECADYTMTFSATGRPIYSGASGHDDCVSSLIMSHKACKEDGDMSKVTLLSGLDIIDAGIREGHGIDEPNFRGNDGIDVFHSMNMQY